jgi:hypothetical protein
MLNSSRLPHPLIDESSNVCLFVPDLKKGSHEDHEPTIEHYKNFLEKNNVIGISQVILHNNAIANKLDCINLNIFKTLIHFWGLFDDYCDRDLTGCHALRGILPPPPIL